MKLWSKFIAVTAAGCLSALIAGAAAAGEITVVAGGGPLPDVLGTLMPMFEKATGNKVKLSHPAGPQIAADLKSGAADLVITNTEVVDQLATSGEVAANGKTLLMISKVAVGVKAGAKRPDISTPEKLKAALLAAKTVGYSQGQSGQHFQTVMQRLGITDQIKPKAVVVWRERASAEPGADRFGELDAFARARLAAFKVPRRWEALPALPRNDRGKLVRRTLREIGSTR